MRPGGVPPVPLPGEAGGLLPVPGDLGDGVQPAGLPRPALVSEPLPAGAELMWSEVLDQL